MIEYSYKKGESVAFMMLGDPSLYSGQIGSQLCLNDYINWFYEKAFEFQIIPGISSFVALCASKHIDLTTFNVNQNILITSANRMNDLEQFSLERFRKNIKSKPNLILFQSYRDWDRIKEIILDIYDLETKIIFTYKLSWEDETIIESNLKNVDKEIEGLQLSTHTLILILPNRQINQK